ncbi:MAG: hypothetical protein P4L76_17810 [Beijerinckiaceae bacterium]|nr:hypothetical protein [Beijerinckiaceae bacterium]
MANSWKDGPLPRVSMGPACYPPPHRQSNEFRASFRVLSFYDLATDSIHTRLDVAVDGKTDPKDGVVDGDRAGVLIQSNAGLSPGEDRKPRDGELPFPRAVGGVAGYSIMAEPGDLSAALRGLADAIDAFAARKNGAPPKPMQPHPVVDPFGP